MHFFFIYLYHNKRQAKVATQGDEDGERVKGYEGEQDELVEGLKRYNPRLSILNSFEIVNYNGN
jgi:hypothetical protein